MIPSLNRLLAAHSLFGRINNQISHEQMMATRQEYIGEMQEAIENDNLPRANYVGYWVNWILKDTQYV